MEERREQQRWDGVGGLGVRLLRRDGLSDGGGEGDGAGQQHRQHGDGQESEAETAGEVDFDVWERNR